MERFVYPSLCLKFLICIESISNLIHGNVEFFYTSNKYTNYYSLGDQWFCLLSPVLKKNKTKFRLISFFKLQPWWL